jgi:hypothetical protein
MIKLRTVANGIAAHNANKRLALSHFGRRPKLRDLAPVLQTDIKSLFGIY